MKCLFFSLSLIFIRSMERPFENELLVTFFVLLFLDRAEPDEDPEVTRAKYFIRDEFLVNLVDQSSKSVKTHSLLLAS